MTVCIDTNVVIRMWGRATAFLPLRQALIDRRVVWALSTDILLEYEEVVAREIEMNAAVKLFRFIEILDQTRGVIRFVSPNFRFRTIASDPDDDKFADCAIAVGADFIITSDHHFDVLIGSGYKPQPITPEEFIRRYPSGY